MKEQIEALIKKYAKQEKNADLLYTNSFDDSQRDCYYLERGLCSKIVKDLQQLLTLLPND